ncbi:MAG: hypothetical protein U5K54_13695 [Cytophagales bacterium]|nr:hypothetical protein [Cytophagales bacterium]
MDLKTRIDIINPDIQLGYQFVLNNRWTNRFDFHRAFTFELPREDDV